MNINTETQAVLSNILPKILPLVDEKQKRLILGIIASELGYGGTTFLSSITGLTRQTIINGENEIKLSLSSNQNDNCTNNNRIRRSGAGRKPLTNKYPDLHEKIQSLIDRDTYGNPESPLLWTTWSVRKIAEELLTCFGYDVHFTSIGKELDAMGYSRQQNQNMCQIGS